MRSRRFPIMATVAIGALFVPVERAALTLPDDGPVSPYAQALADEAGGGRGRRDHAGRDRRRTFRGTAGRIRGRSDVGRHGV